MSNNQTTTANGPLMIDYTNHRGERSWRNIKPLKMFYGTSEYHHRPQWLLLAQDLDKGAQRTFTLADIHNSPVLATCNYELELPGPINLGL